jgi:hypothetical protein
LVTQAEGAEFRFALRAALACYAKAQAAAILAAVERGKLKGQLRANRESSGLSVARRRASL